jgi:uncharacterized protein GlcG (DUF336 family)
MEPKLLVEKILARVDELVPEYLEIPEDKAISNGGASICIIDEDGRIYGKLYGEDKLRCRETFKIAWTKASQVWITGIETNEFERLVFNELIDYRQFGIKMPDMVGYKGGQPVTCSDGTKLSIGFSGFRGTSDLEIVIKAIEKAEITLL